MIVSFPFPDSKPEGFLAVFAKEPVAGAVKTRLSPPLSHEEAAELYRLALLETIDRLTRAGFQPTLFYSGRKNYFHRVFPNLPLRFQGEGNLGERLERAFAGHLRDGAGKMVVIGSDSPDLPPDIIEKAFSILEREEVVVAPARDGGYVLLGESRHHPEIFRAIPWGSDRVLRETRCRAKEKGLTLMEIEGWEDIDDAASLERFLRRSPDSPVSLYVRQNVSFFEGKFSV